MFLEWPRAVCLPYLEIERPEKAEQDAPVEKRADVDMNDLDRAARCFRLTGEGESVVGVDVLPIVETEDVMWTVIDYAIWKGRRWAELPTSAQLKRSTWIAAITASAMLAFVVLPSEYAVDPTGVGGMLGLTQMGHIKMQLAEEAAQDAANTATSANAALLARLDGIEGTLQGLASRSPATTPTGDSVAGLTEAKPTEEHAAVPQVQQQQAETPASEWRDEVSFVLTPGPGCGNHAGDESGRARPVLLDRKWC